MESVLIAGLAAAFALSVLEYWTSGPLLRAVTGLVTAAVSLLLTVPLSPALVPMSLAATVVAALAMELAGRGVAQLRSPSTRR